MPQNKNFHKRITILDECFSNTSGSYTLARLIDVVQNKLGTSVSRKTIQNDIKYIRETIEAEKSNYIDFQRNPVFVMNLYDGNKKVFKYSDANLALGNHLLSKTDKEQLDTTLAILSRYRNRVDFSWLDELFPRIERTFNLAHQDYDGLISYQSNRDYSGKSWVGKLYNQLLIKKVLHVTYKSFKDSNPYLRIIHPYHLKQYNNRWFLLAYEESENYNGITNLALDRIEDIKETTDDIIPNTINWGDYFDEMIGVSRPKDEKAITLKLKFSKDRLPYVLTKPLHGATQKIDKLDPNKRTISITVVPNKELFQMILSFGNDVTILEPPHIVKEMSEIVRNMNELYQSF
ncbi:MAG: WYL domain-containing protein [Nonlabens sp.]|uniref:helix-turn-helix transcriptional regulator n=1 Tax=Nonlabens sp. TaxID=1888209 RepID=UPI00321C2F4D